MHVTPSSCNESSTEAGEEGEGRSPLRRLARLVVTLILVATSVFGIAAPASAQTKHTVTGAVGSTAVYRTEIGAAPYYAFGKTYYNFTISQPSSVVYRNGAVPTNSNQWVFIRYTLQYYSGGAWQFVENSDGQGYIQAGYSGATFKGARFEPSTQRAGYYRVSTFIAWYNTAGSALSGSQAVIPNMTGDFACLSVRVTCSTGAGWVYVAR
jgi:hypothetical protein